MQTHLQPRTMRSLGTTGLLCALVAAPLLATPAPAQAAQGTSSTASTAAASTSTLPSVNGARFTDPATGVSSTYNVYANGVDPSRAVGALYYFGGDYWRTSESEVLRPNSPVVTQLAAAARAKNMILVIPVSPDTNARGDGITWWEDMDRNGNWFRALRSNLDSKYHLDESRTWLTGYSGGAEFISYELLADRQSWIAGGGATIIGGGGADNSRVRFSTAASAAQKKNLSLNWHAGSKDVIGDTNPPEWSAIAAARSGQRGYQAAGFTRTSLDVIPGADHYHYDYAGLTARDMASLPQAPGTQPGTQQPPKSYPVVGGIKARYDAAGGARVLGTATGPETNAGLAGVPTAVYQDFSSGTRIYWTPGYGGHTLKMNSPIGRAFTAAGGVRTWGTPISEPYQRNGGTLVDFSRHIYAYENNTTHKVGAYRW